MSYELYDYQKAVAEKFLTTRSVLLSDDMGLGKTVEAIDLDWKRRVYHRPNNPLSVRTLVVAPLSVIPEWEKHYAWMLPEAHPRVYMIDPKKRSAFTSALNGTAHSIFLCHWEGIRLIPEIAEIRWANIIADEVHRAKNRKALQTKYLKKIKGHYKLGLSGTPADNRPADLWSILNWLYPKTFTSYWRFYRRYVDSIDLELENGRTVKKDVGVKNQEELHEIMAPFYMRRRKELVLPDLPEKYYTERWVTLGPQQRRAYNEMRRDMLAWVGANSETPLAAPIAIARLQRLQQFALAMCDIEVKDARRRARPDEVLKAQAKIDEYKMMLGIGLKDENHYRLLIDEQEYAKQWVEYKKPVVHMIEPSAKLDDFMRFMEDFDASQSLVVFSQFRGIIGMLQQRLQRANISYDILQGGMSATDRSDVVSRFQSGKFQVFLSTIKAGGEGITLTRASTVCFLDRDWSPSKNRQAEDRLHRVGQKNAVQVVDFIGKSTVDLGRIQQFKEKWTWLQQILGDDTFDYQQDALKHLDFELKV